MTACFAASAKAQVSLSRALREGLRWQTQALNHRLVDLLDLTGTDHRRVLLDLFFRAAPISGKRPAIDALLDSLRVSVAMRRFAIGGQVRELVKLGRLLPDHRQPELIHRVIPASFSRILFLYRLWLYGVGYKLLEGPLGQRRPIIQTIAAVPIVDLGWVPRLEEHLLFALGLRAL